MYNDILPALMSIAKKAGKEIMEIYNQVDLAQNIDYKADNSPLTMADRKSHKVIEGLLKELSIYPVMSEEGKQIPYQTRRNWNKFWLVDPLDGTKEFINRNGEFTVNIALIENQAPTVGLVYVPVTGEMYWGAKGEGAWKSMQNQSPILINCNSFSLKDKGLKIVSSRSHSSPETEAYISQFDTPEIVNMGSSLKFMMVAEGKADVYPRFAPTSEWDTAAAQIIVEEAGGKVEQVSTSGKPMGVPVIYNKENILNPYFLVKGDVK